MPDSADIAGELGAMLAAAGAQPRIDRNRIATSPLYDANYHVAIVACAFRLHSEAGRGGAILDAWLKLLQFLAARPALVADFVAALESRRSNRTLSMLSLPRAYLGDQTHDHVVDFLVATGALCRTGDGLVPGPHYGSLTSIAAAVGQQNLFVRERAILEKLVQLQPTKALLGAT